MTRIIIAISLLMIAGFSLIIYIVGGHGHLRFRPHMMEDWIFWGITILCSFGGIYLLIKNPKSK